MGINSRPSPYIFGTMKPFLLIFALFLASISLAAPCPSHAASPETKLYQQAFRELDAGRSDRAAALASRGNDAVLNKVIRATIMMRPGNDYSFADLSAFIDNNPSWPSLNGIIAIAEQKIPSSSSNRQVLAWFKQYPPITLSGFYRYAEAVRATGDADALRTIVRTRWIENDFSENDQILFWNRYNNLLDANAHWEKLDRLLWKGDFVKARRVYPYVSETEQNVADARIALATQSRQSQQAIDRLPSNWQREAGLQYELLRWYVAGKHDDSAVQILLHTPKSIPHANEWWEQRHIIIRRVMDKNEIDLAYRLASMHGLTDGKDFLQAEFLAGWIALRYLNQPTVAEDHFRALYDVAKTPVSRARAAYWLGRSYEAQGRNDQAVGAYQDAAAYDVTFYGQLATTRINASPMLDIKAEPPMSDIARKAFETKTVVAAISRFASLGDEKRTNMFLKAAMNEAKQRSEFAILTDIAYRLHRPDFAVQIAKAAMQKNFMIEAPAYPMLNRSLPARPEAALINALVRQESMFNTTVQSPANAVGLTQLMPATAKDVAKQLGVQYKHSRLTDPDYNLKLGTTYLQQLIERFNGSYILAIAAYNAGPGRVNEWIKKYGDPRGGKIDPVDWIELLPVYETRTYVQRVLENLQAYRARKNQGAVQLMILKDLER